MFGESNLMDIIITTHELDSKENPGVTRYIN